MGDGPEILGGTGAGPACEHGNNAAGGGDLARGVMHGSIVRAVCKIMQSLESVKKSQRNHHGGYQFASTDDIYAALTRKMGEVGLVCLATEETTDVVRVEKTDKQGNPATTQWLKATFGFVLATEEATYHHPSMRRTLYIQVTGPQTFQAAQSYAEKSFLRSLFKLPTGDLDLDAMPQADTEEDQLALAGNGKKRKSSSGAKKDGTDAVFNELRKSIQLAPSRGDLIELRRENAATWAELPERWSHLLDDEYEDRLAELREREAA
jgi:hypothetical protein